jgi:hypothetical protein
VSQGDGNARFTTSDRDHVRLLPGTNLNIGWIRFDQTPVLKTEFVPHE